MPPAAVGGCLSAAWKISLEPACWSLAAMVTFRLAEPVSCWPHSRCFVGSSIENVTVSKNGRRPRSVHTESPFHIGSQSDPLSGARGKILARLAACLILAGWHALPFILVVRFKIPPYAFGHESVGVRFMRAWRWLNDPTDYFYVPVGYLLDLLQRGVMLVLTVSGIDPRHDAETAFRWFALLTIGAH